MSRLDPSEFMEDSQGRFVPVSLVKEIDKERDALVRELLAEARELRETLTRFKARAMGDVQAFAELSAEKYGVRSGGRKGNLTLTTYDGRGKIQLALSESLHFDERIHAAKQLIDDCLMEWAEGAAPQLVSLIQDAFRVDKEGKIATWRILELRKQNIDDPRWLQAMLAIADSLRIASSKLYVRFYERDEVGAWQPLSLDIAAL